MQNLRVSRSGSLKDAAQQIVTVRVVGGNLHGTLENVACFTDTTLLSEYKAKIDKGRRIVRVGLCHPAIAELGISVSACFKVLVALLLDGWRLEDLR
jgi:hypothetical protein